METKKGLVGFVASIVLLAVNPAFAQAPPNDDFANRTPLTGSFVTFSGSLAGATLEGAETNGTSWIPFNATGSLWWTWTAAETGPVVISMPNPRATYNAVSIYTGASLNALTAGPFTSFAKPLGRYLRFDSTAGTTYQIRVAGSDPQPFTFQLTATNHPVFIVQPKDRIVSPYGSAFFSAMATKPQNPWSVPFTVYQWYFNGLPIPGQIYPSLLVHGVTTNQAGTYSVIASNYDGVAQGGSATLTVADTNPVPSLAISPSTQPVQLNFTLSGEPGRWYKIESSTNLHDWVNPVWLQLINPTIPVSVQRLTPNHFVRASLDVPTEVCIAQLKQIQWGVTLFTVENLKQESDTYAMYDVHWYCPTNSINGLMLPCPEAGTYASGGSMTNAPTCTLHARGHVISDAP